MRLLALLAATILVAAACAPPAGPGGEVVLYSSVDDYILRDVVARFEKHSGIRVRLVGDTEATKTTGLVQRLIAERDHPRADVWWSNEAVGTVLLAQQGLFEPCTPGRSAQDFGGAWPEGFHAADDSWFALACRARVVVYNSKRLSPDTAPRTPGDLADPKYKGRIGMARPQFGTTRGQMATLLASCGEPAFRAWLTALHDNGVRRYDGNSAVVRAVAYGEIDAGLTDTDDVFAGQRQQWPVAFEAPPDGVPAQPGILCHAPPLLIPNTVARVRAGPNPAQAALLIQFILSAEVERALAAGEARHIPLRAGLRREFPSPMPGAQLPDLQAVAKAVPDAMRICDEVLGGQ